MYPFDHPSVLRLIAASLEEDVGRGDATTLATIPQDMRAVATIRAKTDLTLAGGPLLGPILQACDTSAVVRSCLSDGTRVHARQLVAEMAGTAAGLLTAERTLLNFLQQLSGVATLTSLFVDALAGTACQIIDTRKTAPGLRLLQKYAVRQGGGRNHRLGLDDGVLIKDNHIAVCGGVVAAVKRARRHVSPWLKIEVECTTLSEVRDALAARADIVLLDNMETSQMRDAVAIVDRQVLVEASGNMDLARVREVAKTGADFISVGALTHSAPAVDLSMAITCDVGHPES